MPSDKPARRLEDIVENAQTILRYPAGMSEFTFEGNRLRHQYDDINQYRLSDIVQSACENAVRRLREESGL